MEATESEEPWDGQPPLDDDQSVLLWLHSLVSSEIDADRGDYLQRDGRNYGIESTAYSLPRLLDNLSIGLMENENRFVTGVRPNGKSTIESFLMARFRSFQYGVRHHKVAQTSAGLQFTCQAVFKDQHRPQIATPVAEFIFSIDAILSSQQSNALNPTSEVPALERFAEMDDIWWMTTLRSFRSALQSNDAAGVDSDLNEWLDFICFRDSKIRSLWKRPSSLSRIIADLPVNPAETTNPVEWFNQQIDRTQGPETELIAWHDLVARASEMGVRLALHKHRPFHIDKSASNLGRTTDTVISSRLFIVYPDDTLGPASALSASIRSLKEEWDQDIHVHAFATSRASTNVEEQLLGILTSTAGLPGETLA